MDRDARATADSQGLRGADQWHTRQGKHVQGEVRPEKLVERLLELNQLDEHRLSGTAFTNVDSKPIVDALVATTGLLVTALSDEFSDAKAEMQRTKYEGYMARINGTRDRKITSKEKYVESLNAYLEFMPSHSVAEMEGLWTTQTLAAGAAMLAAATAHIALTSIVLSTKKDW